MRWLVINQKKNIVFDPKCINHNQSLGHSAMGYILPCCFMDAFASKEKVELFYQEKFKISNVEDVLEITTSPEWIDFYKMLQESPEEAPQVCKVVCGGIQKIDDYGRDMDSGELELTPGQAWLEQKNAETVVKD